MAGGREIQEIREGERVVIRGGSALGSGATTTIGLMPYSKRTYRVIDARVHFSIVAGATTATVATLETGLVADPFTATAIAHYGNGTNSPSVVGTTWYEMTFDADPVIDVLTDNLQIKLIEGDTAAAQVEWEIVLTPIDL